ncbi:hypothetical protein [Actinoplanes sp. NPDC049802]|uniref:hypothetical protein n=1 Tax=Actinoplanes sp. NPDC049802 TaxID=3154742 RepID=UPI0033C6A64E
MSADAVHIVETGLDVPTGVLSLYGGMQAPGPEHEVPTAPGRYRARVSYVPASPLPHADPDEPGPHLHHRIDLWPSPEPRGPTLPCRGPYGWAGWL